MVLRKSRSNRLSQFVLARAAQASRPSKQQIDRYPDERVLGDPLPYSPALPVQGTPQPGQLVELVGTQPELLALEALPLRSLGLC